MATYSGTPRTWSAGETVTAALMNSDVRDPLAALAGAWNSYTPTLGGFTAGNGTATGAYLQVGKLIIFRAKFVFGSSSAGASAYPTLTVPVTAAGALAGGNHGIHGQYFNNSAGLSYETVSFWVSATTIGVAILGTNGVLTVPTASTPFGEAWATSDAIFLSGTYEAA